MAPPVFGAAGTYLSGTAAATAPIAVPTGVTSGQIIVAFLYIESTVAITTVPSGFTECAASPISATGLGAHSVHAYWKRATGADSGTYTFGWTGSIYREGVALRYTGAVTSGDPWDTGAGAANSAARSSDATATPAVSLTTQGADRKLVWCGSNFAGGAGTEPSGFTKRADNTSDIWVADKDQAVAGATGSITGSNAASSYSCAWMGALLPDVGAVATPTAPIVQPIAAVHRASNY